MADQRCGTTAGYKAHWKRGEQACQPCKDAIAAYQRGRGSRSEYRRSYYAANADRLKADSREWYAANRERAAETNRAYRDAHPDQHREDNRRWREHNLEKARKSGREWVARNPEKGRETERRRRARTVGAPYTEAEVLEMYGTACHICGDDVDLSAPRRIGRPGWEIGLHIDHVVPIIEGGPDSIENVRPAHGRCNLRKGRRIA